MQTSTRTTLAALFATSLLIAACGSGGGTASMTPMPPVAESSKPCIPSGTEVEINAALTLGGSEAELCPGARFELSAPIAFTASSQKVYTQGKPTDDTRATLIIVNADLTGAVMMRDYDAAELTNVIVDGNREVLGYLAGDALITAGGFSSDQVIKANVIRNTRSWSSLQIISGYSDDQPCTEALVEGNVIGPSGTSTSMEWADGISLACNDSTVRGNEIFDATDGGIVVFGAPGSVIEENSIRAETRTMLGGINMVDYGVTQGSFEGTVVRNNTIDAAGAVIRIALGMGARVWGFYDDTNAEPPLYGGTVTGNVLNGTSMQYGFIVSGVKDWTVSDNRDEAVHIGKPSNPCGATVASKPDGFLIDPRYSKGDFQPEFNKGVLDLALWAIVKPKPGE
jgi:hypothetical protein